jgi:hypothetical protein
MEAVPVITAGRGLTVMLLIAVQPVDVIVYVISALPVPAPVTIPLLEPTVATARSLLLHVPPVVASVNVIVDPTHTKDAPPIEAGKGFTVTW